MIKIKNIIFMFILAISNVGFAQINSDIYVVNEDDTVINEELQNQNDISYEISDMNMVIDEEMD